MCKTINRLQGSVYMTGVAEKSSALMEAVANDLVHGSTNDYEALTVHERLRVAVAPARTYLGIVFREGRVTVVLIATCIIIGHQSSRGLFFTVFSFTVLAVLYAVRRQ
jgi:hypothetical protein